MWLKKKLKQVQLDKRDPYFITQKKILKILKIFRIRVPKNPFNSAFDKVNPYHPRSPSSQNYVTYPKQSASLYTNQSYVPMWLKKKLKQVQLDKIEVIF